MTFQAACSHHVTNTPTPTPESPIIFLVSNHKDEHHDAVLCNIYTKHRAGAATIGVYGLFTSMPGSRPFLSTSFEQLPRLRYRRYISHVQVENVDLQSREVAELVGDPRKTQESTVRSQRCDAIVPPPSSSSGKHGPSDADMAVHVMKFDV